MFTPRQLIALAILSKKDRTATFEEIWKWILGEFSYYQKALPKNALGDWLFAWSSDAHYKVSFAVALNVELEGEIRRYEPVFKERDQVRFSIIPGAERMIFTAFNIDPVPFPFMRLPAELRDLVYRYVLEFSTSDAPLIVGKNGMLAMSREPESHYGAFSFPPARHLLALLSVSKQVNSEALPVFYFYNHFRFIMGSNLRLLAQFLRCIGHIRREHLGHISISYTLDSTQNTGAMTAFQLLAQCKRLRTFELTVDVEPGIESETIKIPGLESMGRLRGLKQVVLEANGFARPRLQWIKDLREKMMLPKPEEIQERNKTVSVRKKKAKTTVDGGSPELPEKPVKTVAIRKRKAKEAADEENEAPPVKPPKQRRQPKAKTAPD